MNTLAREKKVLILKCLMEGMSVRGTARVVGVQRNTVAKLQLDAGRLCLALHEETVKNLEPDRVQVDELWAFVYGKDAHVYDMASAPEYAGSTWTWVAIDPRTKLVPAWYVGERTTASGKQFMRRLRRRIKEDHYYQLSSDGFKGYPSAVLAIMRGVPLAFGQVVKEYGPPNNTYIGSHKETVKGVPDPAHISTSIIERLNLTLRMSVRRYTRQANAFSKRMAPHVAATDLFFLCYNFIRVHGSLGCTPAQAAGLTERPWTYDDLLDILEQTTPAPKRPKHYRTAKRRRRWQVRPEASAVS